LRIGPSAERQVDGNAGIGHFPIIYDIGVCSRCRNPVPSGVGVFTARKTANLFLPAQANRRLQKNNKQNLFITVLLFGK
jgi:hypothetical protein